MKDFFTWDEMTRDLTVILVIVLVVYVSANITPISIDTIRSGAVFADLSAFLQGKTTSFTSVQAFFLGLEGFLAILALVFFAGIVWISLRARDVHHKVHDQYAPLPVEEVETSGYGIQWQVVLDHASSENPAEWKLAVLEADNMLDEILEDQGYFGDTVADKLKAMSPERITAYDELWEAHKLRNQIAHEGAATMEISKKSVRDAIEGFEKAFKDLGYF
ncbi:MAG: hypothetical protein ACYCZ7_00610 [Minisyncoccota bacterium]